MTKEDYIKSKDFMKLGQAIAHENWQVAGMTVQRMTKQATDADIHDFDRQFMMIKKCIMGRKKTEAQNALAAVVAKRVQMINGMNEGE